MENYIYLDNNATSAVYKEVWETMSPYYLTQYGNAGSIQHAQGRQAKAALERARDEMAQILRCQSQELFFTSGATEAINTVLKGVFHRYQSKGKHIITCKTEHKAVLSCCEDLEKLGAEITYLPVDAQGSIDLQLLQDAIRSDTILVCLMAANNETGIIHPLAEIAQYCLEKKCLFFCDATQYIGKLPLALDQIPIDILCLSAHKFHGPKGIGALYIRRKSRPTQIHPLLIGGGQEHNLRGGTHNLPAIVGMAKALSIAVAADYHEQEIRAMRDFFEAEMLKHIPAIHILQHSSRLPNTSTIQFQHLLATDIMSQMPYVALSAGSACTSGSREPSHVLLAQGFRVEEAKSSIRISFSAFNTLAEVHQVLGYFQEIIPRLREQSPIWQLFQAGIIR